jgi:hypothetical protein
MLDTCIYYMILTMKIYTHETTNLFQVLRI